LTFCHLEYNICDSDWFTPEYKLPIETRLAKCLRRWSSDPSATEIGGQTYEQKIALLLEWFICECVGHEPTGKLRNWWSDGVIELRISQQSRDNYNLAGVTWIGSDGLAPFDIDVKLNPENDRCFANCIFRLGLLDHFGLPALCEPGHPVEIRARRNRDWAMAFELTPPEEAEQ
tara:strand:- start:48 stop:569 length:522 start_codon:yes stop_codon:yes gene_type:complete